jgi:hypothetical protein
MEAIEPNWVCLLWFAGFATIGTVGFLVVAGMFPLRARPEPMRSGAATLLLLGNAILLAALWTGTGLYGYAGGAVRARPVRGLAIVVARRQYGTGRAGRRSDPGARGVGESRCNVLGQHVLNPSEN